MTSAKDKATKALEQRFDSLVTDLHAGSSLSVGDVAIALHAMADEYIGAMYPSPRLANICETCVHHGAGDICKPRRKKTDINETCDLHVNGIPF